MSDKYELIKIEQPIFSEDEQLKAFMFRKTRNPEADWVSIVEKSENPEYLHWQDLRRKAWLSDVDGKLAWGVIKEARRNRTRLSPIFTPEKRMFCWVQCAHYEEILHNFTQNLSGNTMGSAQIMNDKQKREYITRGLIEEAIASSQLEGANTTRAYAQKMITENIPPRDNSQRMIINNYRTMQKIEQDYKNEKMSLALLHDLHMTLTKDGTLDQGASGAFRADEDDIVIRARDQDGKVAFIPPNIEFVEKEIHRLIDFANDELETGFIHPVMKAIMLHFWIGYLHPYGDGNGRLARAMFYWYLLRNGYWAFAFLPISEAIKKSPTQYGWAYIYSEQDDYDLTYFLDFNLRKIVQAKKTFDQYMIEKKKEKELIAKNIDRLDFLNIRQIRIAQFLKSNKSEATNVSAVTTLFGVSQMTAIRDLKDMEGQGLLTPKRKGRNVFYHPTEKLLVLMAD